MKKHILAMFMTIASLTAVAQTAGGTLAYGDVTLDFTKPDTVVITGSGSVNEYSTEFLGYQFTEEGAKNVYCFYGYNNYKQPEKEQMLAESVLSLHIQAERPKMKLQQKDFQFLLDNEYIAQEAVGSKLQYSNAGIEALYEDQWNGKHVEQTTEISQYSVAWEKRQQDVYGYEQATFSELVEAGYIEKRLTGKKYVITALGAQYLYSQEWGGDMLKEGEDYTQAYIKEGYSYVEIEEATLIENGYIEEVDAYSYFYTATGAQNVYVNNYGSGNHVEQDAQYSMGAYDYVYVPTGEKKDVYVEVGFDYMVQKGYIEEIPAYAYLYTASGAKNVCTDDNGTYAIEGNEYHDNDYVSVYELDPEGGTESYYAEISIDDAVNQGYLTLLYKNIWPDVAAEINERYPGGGFAIIVKPIDTTNPMVIGNIVTQNLLDTKVESLDLSKVYIPQIDSPFDKDYQATGKWTFGIPSDNWKQNTTITKLLMPSILLGKQVDLDYHYHVPTMVCGNLPNLEYVAMPKNATCIEPYAFTNKSKIHYAIFNEGLKMIGAHAFDASRFNVLTFPTTIEYIGDAAFGAGFLHDAYFLGEKAPIVEMDAFGSKAYLNCNAIKDHEPDLAFNDKYRACRDNYINESTGNSNAAEDGTYMAAMLHLPENISSARRAAYTDVTRDYHVFALTETRDGKTLSIRSSDYTEEFWFEVNGVRHIGYACDGDSKNNSSVESKGNFKVASPNIMDIGGYNEQTGKYDVQSYIKTSGYYDKYVGEQYRWPSQTMMNRAYAVATNNLLWDGKTSIGEGLLQAVGDEHAELAVCYDTDCDGVPDRCFEDGAQYIGLHQFVLVNYDIDDDTTPEEYPFPTIQGANWYTLCVPLHITAGEVRKVFGKYTQVCQFNKVERDPEGKLKLYFTEETCLGQEDSKLAIVGNHPYMIRPSRYQDADHVYKLPNYMIQTPETVVPETVEAVNKDGNNTGYLYTFVGQYKTKSNGEKLYMNQFDYYLGLERDTKGNVVYDDVVNKNDDGTDDLRHVERHRLFLQGGVTGKWKPFTCVVFPSDRVRGETTLHGEDDYTTFFTAAAARIKGAGGAFGTSFLDGIEEDNPTGVEYEIYCGDDPEPVKVYGLDGRYLGTSGQSLPKGVYVTKGKKYFVK